MTTSYHAFEMLQQHKARLHDSIHLCSGIQLAAWSNKHDLITQYNDHHVLSLYIDEGYDCYRKTPSGWKNGGAPDRFCLMPKETEFTWDIRGDLSFVHLYCTDMHLRQLVEQIWDRSPAAIEVEERVFDEDPQITLLYRQFLLKNDWQEQANHLLLSSASTLLLTRLIRQYSQLRWALPPVKGGLAPKVLRHIKDYMDAHLSQPLLLGELAEQAGLSEFHFARMFKQSTGFAPHQYVMNLRMAKAEKLLKLSSKPLLEIALDCGFSSSSHFSNRFKAEYGFKPSALRQNRR